jgi:hypothetical protein
MQLAVVVEKERQEQQQSRQSNKTNQEETDRDADRHTEGREDNATGASNAMRWIVESKRRPPFENQSSKRHKCSRRS